MGIPIVLYSDEHLEPITVVNVSIDLLRRAQNGEYIRLPVPLELNFRAVDDVSMIEPLEFHTVTFWAEPFQRSPRGRSGRQRDWLYFVRDEELAMKLRPDYLSGQRRDVYQRERAAFVAGLFASIGGM